MSYTPTKTQLDKIEELKKGGYMWNKLLSAASASVVLAKEDDMWVFGLDESIQHNPEGLPIYTLAF